MQLEAATAWRLGLVGVALGGAVTWFVSSHEVTTEVVPEIDLGEELEPLASDGIDAHELAVDRGAIASGARLLAQLPAKAAVDAMSNNYDVTMDLGFDLARRQLYMLGYAGNCHVTVLFYRDSVARADMSCEYTRENWDKVGRFLQRSLSVAKLEVTANEHAVSATRSVNYRGNEAVRARLERELGEVSPVEGTPEELAAYATLAGVDELTFGSQCGISGSHPPGDRAVNTLVTAGRDDLLRNALRGPNPEGRAFAAQGLEGLGKLRNDDRVTMKTLAALPLRIQSCGGCMGFDQASSDVFAQR